MLFQPQPLPPPQEQEQPIAVVAPNEPPKAALPELKPDDKINILFDHMKNIDTNKKIENLLDALIDVGVPTPLAVLQRSYAHTRGVEETRKLRATFENAAVITCCTLNLGTISPRNYINAGLKAMTKESLPAKSLIRLFIAALFGKGPITRVSNASFPGYAIYIDELDLDVKEIKTNDFLCLDAFTIASRVREAEINISGIRTPNRVVLQVAGLVSGWFLNEITGSRYENAFILPPFLELRVERIMYSDEYKLYIVYTIPTNGESFARKMATLKGVIHSHPKSIIDVSSAKPVCSQKAFFELNNPRTGEKTYVSAVSNERMKSLPVMPSGWRDYFDPESGNFFYYNKDTKQKQWEHPAIKSVPPDSGVWEWREEKVGGKAPKEEEVGGKAPKEEEVGGKAPKKDSPFLINGRKITVVKSIINTHDRANIVVNFSYIATVGMKVISSAITQWKIEIVDFGGINPMILVGIAQTEDNGVLITDPEMSRPLGCKGWFLCCTGPTLYGSQPLECVNKPYSEQKSLKKGDVIICDVNTNLRTLSFYVNGKYCGVAFNDIPLDKFLVPCVCMTSVNDSLALTPPGNGN